MTAQQGNYSFLSSWAGPYTVTSTICFLSFFLSNTVVIIENSPISKFNMSNLYFNTTEDPTISAFWGATIDRLMICWDRWVWRILQNSSFSLSLVAQLCLNYSLFFVAATRLWHVDDWSWGECSDKKHRQCLCTLPVLPCPKRLWFGDRSYQHGRGKPDHLPAMRVRG